MERKRPDTVPHYKSEDLRSNARTIESSMSRIQNTIDRLMEQNLQYQSRINQNNQQVQIFSAEIANLKRQKDELLSLASKIEAGRA